MATHSSILDWRIPWTEQLWELPSIGSKVLDTTDVTSHSYISCTLCQYTCMCSVISVCPTLCNPMDCSQPGSSVRGISLARIPEWVAIPSSRVSSHPMEWISSVSCPASGFFAAEPPGKSWYQYRAKFYLIVIVVTMFPKRSDNENEDDDSTYSNMTQALPKEKSN